MDWQLLITLAIVLACVSFSVKRLLAGKSSGCGKCSGGTCSATSAPRSELVTLEVPARKHQA